MPSSSSDQTAVIVTLIALAIGVSAALAGWLMSRALAAVPEENREYKDAPPLGFRVFWLPIQWISHYISPFVPSRAHAALMTRLRQGGLDYQIGPAQFISARIVSAIVFALILIRGLISLEQAGLFERIAVGTYLQTLIFGAIFGWFYPILWLRDRLALRKRELLKTLPFYLDIITLCVEAGLNLQGAMHQAVVKGPKGVLREEFQRVLRDIRAGKGRAESLRAMAQRLNEPSATNFTTAVIQAENMGMSLGPVLRAQADQRRTERFLRAEKAAMEAPVKMLFPLIAFIFPCTFIVLFFPIAIKFMESGL